MYFCTGVHCESSDFPAIGTGRQLNQQIIGFQYRKFTRTSKISLNVILKILKIKLPTMSHSAGTKYHDSSDDGSTDENCRHVGAEFTGKNRSSSDNYSIEAYGRLSI